MGHTITSEALILKTYDIGEADRLCILLTKEKGRLAVASKGVRKIHSKWNGAMQSFQHVRVDLAEHSSGYILRSAECVSSFQSLREDIEKFHLASQGSELLLRLLHDADPEESIFILARDFFQALHLKISPSLLPTFQLSLLSLLGLLPHFDEYPSDPKDRSILAETYLRDHLSSPLRSGAISFTRRGSSGETPISSMFGRAS